MGSILILLVVASIVLSFASNSQRDPVKRRYMVLATVAIDFVVALFYLLAGNILFSLLFAVAGYMTWRTVRGATPGGGF